MTDKILNDLVRKIADETGGATSHNEAVKKGLTHYLAVDKFNGYQLIERYVKNNGERLAFNLPNGRVTGHQFYIRLLCLLAGLQYSKPAIKKEGIPGLSTYYAEEISKIRPGASLKIKNGHAPGETKWLSLNDDSAAEIVKFLQENYNV